MPPKKRKARKPNPSARKPRAPGGEKSAFKYDVAISFLHEDLEHAKDLADRLEGLDVFVYTRYDEVLLGGDGMEEFGRVFSRESRLAVILHRAGWGETDWTSFEESHIKSRALHNRMKTFFIVRLDDAELPLWVPEFHIYATQLKDSREAQAVAIRYRVALLGAVPREVTVTEKLLAQARRRERAQARKERMYAARWPDEICNEARDLYRELLALVDEFNAGGSSIELKAAAHELLCAVTDPVASLALRVIVTGFPREYVLRVSWWQGWHQLPSPQNVNPGGQRYRGAEYYSATVAEDDDAVVWVWESTMDEGDADVAQPKATRYRSRQLAAELLERLFDKIVKGWAQ